MGLAGEIFVSNFYALDFGQKLQWSKGGWKLGIIEEWFVVALQNHNKTQKGKMRELHYPEKKGAEIM